MDAGRTALILIGYHQNDYLSLDDLWHGVVEDSTRFGKVLANTLDLIERLLSSSVLIVSPPIVFTDNYSEFFDSIGMLNPGHKRSGRF